MPGLVSIATGVLFALWVRPPQAEAAAPKASNGSGAGTRPLIRIFGVLAVTTVCGGLIFNGTLVSLPKVFDLRLTDFTSSAIGVSGLVSLVYVFGAFAQVLVGLLLDRYPLRLILMGVAALQVPFLLAAAKLVNVPLLLIAGLMMFTIFGAIPITDTLVARNTSDRWRSRIYAVKIGGSLTVAAVAVPLVSLVYGATREYAVLFGLFAALSAVIAVTGWLLPRGEVPPKATPAPAPAGGN